MNQSTVLYAEEAPQTLPGRQSHPEMPVSSKAGSVGRAIASIVVFTLLGSLLVYGHLTRWTIPEFSALIGHKAEEQPVWCSEHGVPESHCVECNPDLLPKPKGYGWCKVHGVHECPWCHPEVAQMKEPPRITVEDLARVKAALDLTERPHNNEKCKLHQRRIQFVSQEALNKAGIGVGDPVGTRLMVESIQSPGEVTYDQTHTAHVSARVAGAVFHVFKQVGDPVSKGTVLALIDAAEVGKAKSEFLQALAQVRLRRKTYENLISLAGTGATPERSMREAESALSEANIRLLASQQALTNLGLTISPETLKGVPDQQLTERVQFLGLPDVLSRTFDPKVTTANLLPVVAPLNGVVVAREAVAGEVVDSSKVLFAVVDLRRMWLTLDLRAEEASRVVHGQEVRFTPDGGKEVRGKIIWISAEADRKTRTVKVRVSLDNQEGRLRANTFGSGQVILREEKKAIVVPNSAVHWEGCCHIVFVRDKHFFEKDALKVFHVRTVRPGIQTEKDTEIIAGLLPDEVVATTGSGALRDQLLRNNLGAG